MDILILNTIITAQQSEPRGVGIALALACLLVLSTLALVAAVGLRRRIDKIDPDPKPKR